MSAEENDKEDSSHGVREQDCYLPIANIDRIMKHGIPASAKISREAKETVQECVSEFISFITSEACEKCHLDKRKTINGDDILSAMRTLGFDPYLEPLQLYLTKYRDSAYKRAPKKPKEKEKENSPTLYPNYYSQLSPHSSDSNTLTEHHSNTQLHDDNQTPSNVNNMHPDAVAARNAYHAIALPTNINLGPDIQDNTPSMVQPLFTPTLPPSYGTPYDQQHQTNTLPTIHSAFLLDDSDSNSLTKQYHRR